MQKAVKSVSAVIGRVFFIGFSIQIVMGLIWMLCNFTGFQEFGESYFYVEISKNFLCDEYTGILYPVFLLFARGVEGLIHIPYYYVMYLVQLAIALYAAHFFLQAVHPSSKFWNIWGSLAIITLPMAMQSHLAILPKSLTCSFLLTELGFVRLALREGEPLGSGHLMRVLPFWLLTALLEPQYLYLGAIPVGLLFLYGLVRFGKKNPRQLLYNCILIAAFAGIIMGMNDLTQVEGEYGRVRQSFSASMLSRCSWTTMFKRREAWPEELRVYVDDDIMWQTSFYADNISGVLEPYLEEKLGIEDSQQVFREIAESAWNLFRPQILHEMAWDVFGYSFSPIAAKMFLDGRGYASYCTRNYDIMRQKTPVLTKYYFNYGCWWFGAGLALAAAAQLLVWCRRMLEGKLFEKRGSMGRKLFFLIVCIMTGGVTVVWYTMQGAAMMDYKHTTAIVSLWLAWMTVLSEEAVKDISKD